MNRTVRKILALLLAALLLGGILPAAAAAETGAVAWNYDEATATLTISGWGPMPEYLEGEDAVLSLSSLPWYAEAQQARRVVIEEGVTTVAAFAFAMMPALTSVELPRSVVRIGKGAFYFSNSLREIPLPEGLTYLGDFAFVGNALESIVLPAGLRSLRCNFVGMPSLTDITLPEGLETIEDCFSYAALESLTVPASVQSVSGCTFLGLKTLYNRSSAAVAADQMAVPATEYTLRLMPLVFHAETKLYAEIMKQAPADEEAAEALELEALEQLRLQVNDLFGLAIATPEEMLDFISENGDVVFEPAPGAVIYCLSGSAEDDHAHSNRLPHYLLDQENALCGAKAVYTGTAGENVAWMLDAATGTLTFTGSGRTDWDLEDADYHSFDPLVTSVAFEFTDGPITALGHCAFKGMTALESLTIPEGVEELGLELIYNSGVRELTLPASAASWNIAGTLHLGSTPLETIALTGESDVLFTENGGLYYRESEDRFLLVKLPAAAVGLPLAQGVAEIKAEALEGLREITEFTVPGTVEWIWPGAFTDLPALETITLLPGAEALADHFGTNACAGSTRISAFVTEPEDPRFINENGVLFRRSDHALVAYPGQMTELTLPPETHSLASYADTADYKLDRLTIEAVDFTLGSTSGYGYLFFLKEDTEFLCRKGSDAEDYALHLGYPVTYLEGVTLTGVDFTCPGTPQIPCFQRWGFSDLGVIATLRYSDGTSAERAGTSLNYTLYYNDYDYSWCPEFKQEAEAVPFTVSYAGSSDSFTLDVVPGVVAYRFDISGANDTFARWENLYFSDLGVRLIAVAPDGTESEVTYPDDLHLSVWKDGAWVNFAESDMTAETGEYRLNMEYRGYSQEMTVRVTEEEYRFYLDTSEALLEVPQYFFYNKETSGLKVFADTPAGTVQVADNAKIGNLRFQTTRSLGMLNGEIHSYPHENYYGFRYLDTTVPGDAVVYYIVTGIIDEGPTFRSFDIRLPVQVTVVPGDIAEARLDVSGVSPTVAPGTYFSAGDLGVRLIKTMADGSVEIDEDPAVSFNWTYMPGSYFDPHQFYSFGDGAVSYVTVSYGGLRENFTVTAHRHDLSFVAAAPGANCTEAGTAAHWHCLRCGQNFADEAAAEPVADLSDGVFGPHIPAVTAALRPATCTDPGMAAYSVCGVCGQLFDTDGRILTENGTIAAAGHNYRETARVAPTCVREGSVTYTCLNDAAHTYTETLPATGQHADPDGNGRCDACGQDLGTAPDPGTEAPGNDSASKTGIAAFMERIADFFRKIADFFRNLFRF